MIIAPKRNAGCARVSKCDVHPTVMIEIKRNYTVCSTGPSITHALKRNKSPFARVQIHDGVSSYLGRNQIDCPIIVNVAADGIETTHSLGTAAIFARQPNVHTCKGTVTVVSEHQVAGFAGAKKSVFGWILRLRLTLLLFRFLHLLDGGHLFCLFSLMPAIRVSTCHI